MVLKAEELDKATLEKLGVKIPRPIDEVGDSLIVLGRVFRALRGLSDEEALRVLQQAMMYILNRTLTEIKDGQPVTYAPPMEWTIQVVAKAFKLTPSILKQRGREGGVSLARQAAMYILSMTNKYTLGEIGQALGGRSSATVSHGYQRVTNLLPVDDHLRASIDRIMAILYEGNDDDH